jgi:hypothetical protein
MASDSEETTLSILRRSSYRCGGARRVPPTKLNRDEFPYEDPFSGATEWPLAHSSECLLCSAKKLVFAAFEKAGPLMDNIFVWNDGDERGFSPLNYCSTGRWKEMLEDLNLGDG